MAVAAAAVVSCALVPDRPSKRPACSAVHPWHPQANDRKNNSARDGPALHFAFCYTVSLGDSPNSICFSRLRCNCVHAQNGRREFARLGLRSIGLLCDVSTISHCKLRGRHEYDPHATVTSAFSVPASAVAHCHCCRLFPSDLRGSNYQADENACHQGPSGLHDGRALPCALCARF